MFAYLSGTVAALENQMAVIDCAGVGYACNTTGHTISRLSIGTQAKLYTYVYIREDAFDIYGFYSRTELESFKLLIGVSGVGPKAALSILSVSTPEDLSMAIMTGNEKLLTGAPGVGKKIAQRILLELKDKLDVPTLSQGEGSTTAMPAALGKAAEAQAALYALGFSATEVTAVMRGINMENMTTDQIVREALKKTLK